jgi:hypothetical protein
MTSETERLRAVDSIWLDADTLGPPIAIGALVTAEGPGPDLADVRALIASRLDQMPRLRQRVTPVTGGVKRPTWEPAGDVDLEHHVRTFPVEAPGDTAALERAVSAIMEVPLDTARPLWDVHLLSPISGGGWAMITRKPRSRASTSIFFIVSARSALRAATFFSSAGSFRRLNNSSFLGAIWRCRDAC